MNNKRPVNLDLTKFHFPPMAILSIAHRISGVLLFLLLPLAICLLHASLASPATFAQAAILYNPVVKFLVWVMCCAIVFHLIAGIRHLVMDFGYGESVAAGSASAYVVFVIAAVAFILMGYWLW